SVLLPATRGSVFSDRASTPGSSSIESEISSPSLEGREISSPSLGSGRSSSISSSTAGPAAGRALGGSVEVGPRDGAEAAADGAGAETGGAAGRGGAVVVAAEPSAPPYFVASARKTSVVAPLSVSSTPMPFIATASK